MLFSTTEMNKIPLLLLIFSLCLGCGVPPEAADRHYSINIANNSEKSFYIGFSRSYHANPSKNGVINYRDFKYNRPSSSKTTDFLVHPGEINNKALDIGSDDGYNSIEVDMNKCNWFIYFVDAEVVDSMPFEELNNTFEGLLFMKEYTLQEIQNLNFTITFTE